MKITPSNQTLILAGEQVPQSAKPGVSGGQGLDAAPGGAVLRRVTMLTALPDSTLVYVRADYAPLANASAGTTALVAPARPAQSSLSLSAHSRDVYGNPRSSSGRVGLSIYLKPEEQYAQTQRILAGGPRTSHLDVNA